MSTQHRSKSAHSHRTNDKKKTTRPKTTSAPPCHTLATQISRLFDTNKYWDVKVTVIGNDDDNQLLKCHKLVLATRSPILADQLFPSDAEDDPVDDITIDDIDYPIFDKILRYMYRGEITHDQDDIEDVFRAAMRLEMRDLQMTCVDYMTDTLAVKTCVNYWALAYEFELDELEESCETFFVKNINPIVASQSTHLEDIDEEMLKSAIARDDLMVRSEVDVCQALVKWLNAKVESEHTVHPMKLLPHIRWSAVPSVYVTTQLLSCDSLKSDQESSDFLVRVLSYQATGIQFERLKTFHRPTTCSEMCAVVFCAGKTKDGKKTVDTDRRNTKGDKSARDKTSVKDQNEISIDMWRVSLQRKDAKVQKVTSPPIKIEPGAVVCTNGQALYVTGVGNGFKETWRWDVAGQWAKCRNMIFGRNAHSAAFVGTESMYVIGGTDENGDKVMKSINKFNTARNRWVAVGYLKYPGYGMTCVGHNTSVFLFGGTGKDRKGKGTILNCVQVFDTVTRQCTLLDGTQPLMTGMRAVRWESSVILVGQLNCLIFDLDSHEWQERQDFGVGVENFGLVLENQTLFVLGGGRWRREKDGTQKWKGTDVIKCIPVMDVIDVDSDETTWSQHAKLPSPGPVEQCAVLTMALRN